MLGLTWCNRSVQPQCKELEERCNTQSESYETKKKEVIGMLMCVFLSPHPHPPPSYASTSQQEGRP